MTTPQLKYAGEFANDQMTGVGKLETDQYSYEGDLKANVFDGFGIKAKKGEEEVYEGQFKAGKYCGDGMLRIQGKVLIGKF